VINLLSANNNNQNTIEQIKKMIANVDKGIENTPQSLGLISEANKQEVTPDETNTVPANVPGPTLEEAQPAN
jgi:hypothetical protein